MIPLVLLLLLACSTTGEFVSTKEGDINLVLSVPHNGYQHHSKEVYPDIPVRQPGCKDSRGECIFPGPASSCHAVCKVSTKGDMQTQDIAKQVVTAFHALTGRTMHLVISNLHRSRMDPNREVVEATQNNTKAVQAYNEFHGAIRSAIQTFGEQPGILVDLHRQVHQANMIEIGYSIKKRDLNKEIYGDGNLSIRSLATRFQDSVQLKDFIRGSRSLGALFEKFSYAAVPAPKKTCPGTDKYFNGGYITATYGSTARGVVDAVQLELPKKIRKVGRGSDNIKQFSKDLAQVLAIFFSTNYQQLEFA